MCDYGHGRIVRSSPAQNEKSFFTYLVETIMLQSKQKTRRGDAMPDRGKSTDAVARAPAARAVTPSRAVLLALVAASAALGAGASAPLGSYIVVLKNSLDDPVAVG